VEKVVERPALPAEIRSLVLSLQAVCQQYGYAINRIIDEPEFIAPSLLNSWTNYGGAYTEAGYYKDPCGRVHLRGAVTGGTIGSNPIFTLPEDYRPVAQIAFPVASYDGAVYVVGVVDITSAGHVRPNAGHTTFLSLNGISFAAV
jgi:hypothetical protein